MARIDKNHLEQKEQERYTIQDTAGATYFFFDKGDERFFQLNMYGTPGRKVPGSRSQTLQFDRNMAETLIGILRRGFNI
jgi:hypothetical protein